MFLILCLLVTVGLGRCLDHLPTREEIEISINRTIEEVEKKIQADPTLPKLSRKDIVDILQNITTKDLISDYKTLEKTRNDYQRALVVVLPYNSNGAEEHLKDLYTKPPIIQMLSDDDIFHEEEERNRFLNENASKKQVSDNFIPTFPAAAHESVNKQHEKVDSKLDSTPEKFSFDLEKLSEILTTTKRPAYTWRPVPKVSDSGSFLDAESSKTEAPISKSTQHVLLSDQWRYHPPPTSQPQPSSTTPEPSSSEPPIKPQYHPPEYFLPTIQSSPEVEYNHHHQQQQEESAKQDSNTLKFFASEAMNLPTTKPAHISLFVTPMSDTKTQISSKISEEHTGLFVTPMSDNSSKISEEPSQPTMRPEIEDLLKSIGLQPLKTPNDSTFDKQGTQYQIPDSNNVVYNPSFGLTTTGVDTVSIADQNTFDSSDQIQTGVSNLTPAIQLLFKKFGLPTNLNFQSLTTTTTTTTTTVKPTQANYYSYTNFKPLPNSSVRDKEMRDFLAKFGLGESRSQKSMRQNTRETPSLIEAVPGNMKRILENIGLIRPRARSDDTRNQRHSTPPAKLHVFKPQESVFSDRQRAKISELLDTVKKVQKGKATIDDVQKVADEVLESTKTLPEGPDPVSLEEILKLYKEDLKNEVKRQQTDKEFKENANRNDSLVKKDNVVKKEVANQEKVVGEGKVILLEKDKKEKDVKEEKEKEGKEKTNVKEENSRGKEKLNVENGNKGKEDDDRKKAASDQSFSFSSAASSDSQSAAQDIVYTSVPTTTTASSATTAKGSFFDTFDIETALKNANVDTTKTSSTESSNNNIAALEESFGGTTPKPDPILPTKRRTGLYFLVDWNTFLEVGEDGKEKVNLRFQPRAGDRTRFVKVTVP